MDRTTRWPGLAPDVVRDVASRLHDAGDFVRLHAVCKPWRSSRDAPPPTNQFLPWLLAAAGQDSRTPLRFRCIFSKSSYRAPPPPLSVSRSNWVGSADATAVRYITVAHGYASLQDPLTGEVTRVAQISYFIHDHWDKEKPHGIIYGDGTVLLYTRVDHNRDMARFSSALLRSREARWTLVDRILKNETPRRHGGFCTAYHDGRILILEDRHWRVVTPGVAIAHDVLVQMPVCNCPSHSNYILESRGELLWVSIKHTYENGEEGASSSRTFSVQVHALEDDASAPTKMQLVRKNGPSLADRVFFLGSPNSIAMDSSQLGGHGGCVYFVYYNHSKALPGELFGVYRYNLVDGKTEFVERVPPGWDNEKCTWLVPQPAMSPIQEITKRSRKALEPNLKGQKTSPACMTNISRHYEPWFRVIVRNLPPRVNSSELQLLFSKHGRVSSAEVIYRKTRRSERIGLLTVSMVYAHPQDSVDAFKGLYLDGCKLEVTFVKERRRPRRPRLGAPQLHVT